MTKKEKRKLDIAFSAKIRARGYCQKCLRSRDVQQQCAHIFSRRFMATRWEELNALDLCAAHHRWAHDRPVEFVEWVRDLLGEKNYEKLKWLSHFGPTPTYEEVAEKLGLKTSS